MDQYTQKAIEDLQSSGSLFSSLKRRKAALNLVGTSDPEAIEPLFKALHDPKPKVQEAARQALSHLKDNAIDRFCELWDKTRASNLEEIMVESGYVANHPSRLKIITRLKQNKIDEIDSVNVDGVDLLIGMLGNYDQTISTNAALVLSRLTVSESIDYLCSLWEESRSQQLEKLIVDGSYTAKNPLRLKIVTCLKQSLLEEIHDTSSDGVEILLELRSDSDKAISVNSKRVLLELSNSQGIDRLCELWAQSRAPELEKLVLEGGYIASSPFQLKILTHLKQGELDEVCAGGVTTVDILFELRADRDKTVSTNANRALLELSNSQGIDRLCELWAQSRASELEKMTLKGKYLASSPFRLKILTHLKQNKLDEVCSGGATTVDLLLELETDSDKTVSTNAKRALLALSNSQGIDRLCKLWGQSSDPKLEQIILEAGYVAKRPLLLNLRTLLKIGKMDEACAANADGVVCMLQLRNDKDKTISTNAGRALTELTNPQGINRLCALWDQRRDQDLEALLLEGDYTASHPLRLKILTLLKRHKIDEASGTTADAIDILLALKSDEDKTISANARKALLSLKSQSGVDYLCALWDEKRDSDSENIILKAGHVASQPDRLFFLTTFLQGKLTKKIVSDENLESCIFDEHETVRKHALKYLIEEAASGSDDRAFGFVMDHPDSHIPKQFQQLGWYPHDPSKRALFYFVLENHVLWAWSESDGFA